MEPRCHSTLMCILTCTNDVHMDACTLTNLSPFFPLSLRTCPKGHGSAAHSGYRRFSAKWRGALGVLQWATHSKRYERQGTCAKSMAFSPDWLHCHCFDLLCLDDDKGYNMLYLFIARSVFTLSWPWQSFRQTRVHIVQRC